MARERGGYDGPVTEIVMEDGSVLRVRGTFEDVVEQVAAAQAEVLIDELEENVLVVQCGHWYGLGSRCPRLVRAPDRFCLAHRPGG